MTEEIIIDGVNVAGCVRLQDDKISCNLGGECKGWDNCYYKQLKHLEQENKELKEEKQAIKSYIGIEVKTILERLEELDEWKHNDKLLLWKYRSALEEINITVKQLLQGVSSNCINNTPYLTALSLIQNKINEILQ